MSSVFGAHGHTFTVRVSVPDLAPRVERALATLRIDDPARSVYSVRPAGHGKRSLFYDDALVGSPSSDDRLLLLLHWHINQRVVDGAVSRHTTLHAAAARSPRGGAVLLPAPMESGKTTTVTGLLRAGWDYLTDEAAAVGEDGTVLAYAKPLTIDRGSWLMFPDLRPDGVAADASSWLVPATATGAGIADSGKLALIAFPAYRPDEPTSARRLAAGSAAHLLAGSTFHFERNGPRDLACLSQLARTVPAYQLTIGHLATAVELINKLEIEARAAAA